MAEIGPNSAAFHSLRRLPAQLGLTGDRRPAAIVVISGHWETSDGAVHITSRDDYGGQLLYDYGGFPAETYRLQYSAPGSSALASRIHGLLHDSGIASKLDSKRLWDHGVFIPLKVMLPAADIPVVQLSLLSSLSPAAHLDIGRALAPLRDEKVLIVASGFVTHNLSPSGDMRPFVAALTSALTAETGESRSRQLQQWEKMPAARHAHSREEHFIPLLVAVGAAEEEKGEVLYSGWVMQGAACFANYAFGQVHDISAQ